MWGIVKDTPYVVRQNLVCPALIPGALKKLRCYAGRPHAVRLARFTHSLVYFASNEWEKQKDAGN